MGNKIQAGFDLVGKVFGKRLADVGMYAVIEILSTIAVLLPLIGYFGISMLTQSFGSLGSGNLISSSTRLGDRMITPSMIGSIFGIIFLVLLISIVVQSFVQGVGVSIVKHANEDSTEGFGSTIALAYSKWGRLIGLMALSILLVIALAFGFVILVSIFALIFVGIVAAGAYLGLSIIIPLIIVFCYYIFPLFYMGPIDAMMSTRPVAEIIGNALTKSIKIRWPVFITVLCVSAIGFVFNLLLTIIGVSILYYILMIPIALITWCILFPYYEEYSKDCIPKPIMLQISGDQTDKPEEPEDHKDNDINPNL